MVKNGKKLNEYDGALFPLRRLFDWISLLYLHSCRGTFAPTFLGYTGNCNNQGGLVFSVSLPRK